MTLLYIEDDYEYHNMVDFMLKDMDIKILHAYNVQEGIDLLKSNKVNFILSDINMEGMDGLSFLAAIKRDKNLGRIPVVIVTAEPSGEKARYANEQGAVGFLAKPFTQNELIYLVKTFAIIGDIYSLDESSEDVLMRKKQKLMMMLAKDSLERDFLKATQSFMTGLIDMFRFAVIGFYLNSGDNTTFNLDGDGGSLAFLPEFKKVSSGTAKSIAQALETKEEFISNAGLHSTNTILKSWISKNNLVGEVVLPLLNLDDRDFLLGASGKKENLSCKGFFWAFRSEIFSTKETDILKRTLAQGNPILSHLSNVGKNKKLF